MLNPEDFRKQIGCAWQNLLNRSKEIKDTAILQKEEGQKERRQWYEKQEQERQQKNQALGQLDTKLQIGSFLEIIKGEISQTQEVKRWETGEGLIAYSLIFEERERKILVGVGYRSLGGGGKQSSSEQYPIYGLRRTRDALGIVLNTAGQARICVRRCAENSKFHSEKENPIDWFRENYRDFGMNDNLITLFSKGGMMPEEADTQSQRWYLGKEGCYDGLEESWLAKDRVFLLTQGREQKRFMKALIDFSIIVKAGWIK